MRLRMLLTGLVLLTPYSLYAQVVTQTKTGQKPHPDALPNKHQPGEVDRPELVPSIVAHPSQLAGLVMDETDAELVGEWQYSTHTPPYVGLGYLHDRKSNKGKSSATFRFRVPITGEYEVRVSHCYNVRRATNTPVIIKHADGTKNLKINQQEQPSHDKLFRSLGTFRFDAHQESFVRFSNEGTDGKYVIVDALQLLPVSTARYPKQPVQDLNATAGGKYRVKTDTATLIPFRVTIPGSKVRFQMVPIPGREAKDGKAAVEPFWMATCEVTWEEFHEFMKLNGVFRKVRRERKLLDPVEDQNQIDAVTAPTPIYDPSYHFHSAKEANYPAHGMTRYCARQYTKWLSLITGLSFRLATTDEWEHACLAGTEGPFHFGDARKAKEFAFYNGDFEESGPTKSEKIRFFDFRPQAVGKLKPNAWGLYDMHGNVSEWVVDRQLIQDHHQWLTEDFDSENAVREESWEKSVAQMYHMGGSCLEPLSRTKASLVHSALREYWINDPCLPVSSWWFAPESHTPGFRIVCSLGAEDRSELEAFWGPDSEGLTIDLIATLASGRTEGVVPNEPAVLQQLQSQTFPGRSPWEFYKEYQERIERMRNRER